MMKRTITAVLLTAVAVFALDEWNEKTGFQEWGSPSKCTVTYENGRMQMNVTGNDCSVLNTKVDLDPKEYEAVEFEYRASGGIKPNPGQIYFAGEDGAIVGEKYWTIDALNVDGEWHRMRVSEIPKGMALWTNEKRITKLRFDPFNFGTGNVEIRLIKFIRRMPFIEPADDDIGYGSSLHTFLWGTGRAGRNPMIVGKGNVHDHRYRFLARVPLDKLLPKGHVDKAELQFQLRLYVGTKPKRVYLVEAIDEEILKLKANDLNASKVTLLGKVELSKDNVGLPVKVDMTAAVNRALADVWSGVTIRIRPEYEPNDDPGASGAAINPNLVKMYYK
ncbi:MAG: hypothetical protein J5833_04385 [Victivallales bacterium]|nr:hypothetical protein [Victivallales bacterium]